MLFTPEHEEARRTLQRFIANEINPYVDEWEEAEAFPPTNCSRSSAVSASSASPSRPNTAAWGSTIPMR